MLFGRMPWDIPHLPNSKQVFLEKFYEDYLRAMGMLKEPDEEDSQEQEFDFDAETIVVTPTQE